VGPGMTVIDLGCGPGFFTIPARHVVGAAGHVIAADVQPEMLDHLRGRLSQAGIADVDVVLATEGRVPSRMWCSRRSSCTRRTTQGPSSRSARGS
jgi:cyclopropane fatty-acyl-phospholipid synthase-like methyltransferase